MEFHSNYANLSTKPGSKNSLSPVGSHPRSATPLGVHDLIGNVWEWVGDNYSPYKGSSYQSKNFSDTLKVLRGQSSKDIGHFPGAPGKCPMSLDDCPLKTLRVSLKFLL